MAYETVLKIKKASFQVGEKPIKSIINGKAEQDEDFMPGGYIVGNEGLDVQFTVKKGFKIMSEIFIDSNGYQGLRVYTEKV